MVHCHIAFENNAQAVYTAGEMLKGTIELRLDELKKINGLFFIVYGVASCHWTESESYQTKIGSQTRLVFYDGKEVYLNQKTYLFGAHGAKATEMAKGLYRYDFECQLPIKLPASLESSYGNIRYNIEAVLDIAWRFDKKFKLKFTVIRHDDLNRRQELKIASKSEEVKQFCCLFCQSDPLMMTVTLPQTGYTSGQNIAVTVNYNNKSNVAVTSTKICLKRIIRHNSQTPLRKTKVESTKLVEIFARGVDERQRSLVQKTLQIPRNMLNSNSQHCKVVQVTYEVKVEAEIVGFHKNIVLSIPITLGSVPLETGSETLPLPLESPPRYSLCTLLPEIPPPSFKEAVKMPRLNEGDTVTRLGGIVADSSPSVLPSVED